MRLNGLSTRKLFRWGYTSEGKKIVETWRENPGLGAILMEAVVKLKRWDGIAKAERAQRESFASRGL